MSDYHKLKKALESHGYKVEWVDNAVEPFQITAPNGHVWTRQSETIGLMKQILKKLPGKSD